MCIRDSFYSSHTDLSSFLFYTPLFPILPLILFLISFYTCRYLHILIYIPDSSTIWPRTFYRSGWLRCDVVISVCVLCFELVDGVFSFWAFDIRCYIILYLIHTLYYTLLLYIISYTLLHIILYYLILYSSPHSFSFSSFLLFWSYLIFHSPLFCSQYSFYTCRYLHILIYIQSFLLSPNKLSINIKRNLSILCLG